jgi:sporulation-control protein spo0M
MTEKQVLVSIPYIINLFSQAVEVTKIYVFYSFPTAYTIIQEENRVIFLNLSIIWNRNIQMRVATYKEHAMKSTVDHIDFDLLSLTCEPILGSKPTS